MSDRPSLRHGLPYRWWRTGEFWAGLSAVLVLALLLFVLYLWFFGGA